MYLLVLILVMAALATAATAAGLTIQGAFAPAPVVYDLPNQVTPSVVHAGDKIDIQLKQCVQDGVNGHVYYTIDRTLREQDNAWPARNLERNSHTIPVGCYTTHAAFNQVPSDLKPGTWHIESSIVAYGAHGPKLLYSVTEWFTVVPDDQPLPEPDIPVVRPVASV